MEVNLTNRYRRLLTSATTADKEDRAEKLSKEEGTVVFRVENGRVVSMNVVGQQDKRGQDQVSLEAKQSDFSLSSNTGKYPDSTKFCQQVQKNPEICFTNHEIWSEAERLIKDYYAGTVSTEEVQSRFMDLARRNFQVNEKNHMINGDEDKKLMLETFYNDFRRSGISGALLACSEEGATLVADAPPKGANGYGWMGHTYYNSDYYYKSEEFISAITQGAGELASELGQQAFEVPNYAEKQLWMYEDFNTAWGNPMVFTNQYMKDLTQKPPYGFTFSLYNDGDNSSLTVSYRDASDEVGAGKTISKTVKLPFSSVTSKVTASKVTVYKGSLPEKERKHIDYYNAADCLQFDGETNAAVEVNQYLDNFNVYTFMGLLLHRQGIYDYNC